LAGIEELTVGDPGENLSSSVILRANQFGPGLALNATIRGVNFTDVTQTLNVYMAGVTNLDLSGLTMIDFGEPKDSVVIIGGAGAETITGADVRTVFVGGGGNDTLNGQGANDTYVLGAQANSPSLHINDLGGTDTITSTINRSLGVADYSEIDNLTLLGTAVAATGNGLQNVITGNAAANVLTAVGASADTLRGLDGSDTYAISAVNHIISETNTATSGTADRVLFTGLAAQTYVLAANVEMLTLMGAANTNGTGNAVVNTIIGNVAANILTAAGTGNVDILRGMGGDDTYVIDASIDAVQESAGAGTADHVKWTGTAGQTYILAANVELLTLMGTAATNATGNAAVNTLTGNNAANTLRAVGAHVDTLVGLNGNDTYYTDNTIDTVIEANTAGAGTADQVFWTGTTGQTYSMHANVELLTLTGGAATNAMGNSSTNTITGNAAANTLTAFGPTADTLIGGLGNDIYVITSVSHIVNETTNGGGAADRVDWTGTAGQLYALTANVELLNLLGTAATNGTGNTGANTITGNSATNVLRGGSGIDLLLGGGGMDTLFGDGGNDTFRFLVTGDSAVGGARDVIQDFDDGGDNDVIDLSSMASVSAFIGAAEFTAAGQVRAVQSGANVLVQINTVGAGGAESEILIANATLGAGAGQVDAGDFLL
jgi:Ca2+-binding RTX toxin-like protein